MKFEVTRQFLKDNRACEDGYRYWIKECEGLTIEHQFQKLSNHRFDWYTWLAARVLKKLGNNKHVQFAVLCADLVLHIYEKKYPDDLRPRKAIEAAKKFLTTGNAAYAADAAAAAYAAYAYATDAAAADAAYAAYAAAAAAAYAAYDAYDAYAADAYATDAAADADAAAAAAAADTAYAAYAAYAYAADDAYAYAARIKTINISISLIKGEYNEI